MSGSQSNRADEQHGHEHNSCSNDFERQQITVCNTKLMQQCHLDSQREGNRGTVDNQNVSLLVAAMHALF